METMETMHSDDNSAIRLTDTTTEKQAIVSNMKKRKRKRRLVNVVETISKSFLFPVHYNNAFNLNSLANSLSSSLLQKFNKDSAKSMFALSISKIKPHFLEQQHLSTTLRCKLDAELKILFPKIGNFYRAQIQLDSNNEVHFITVFDVFVIFLAHEDVRNLKEKDIFIGDEITVVLTNLIVLNKELLGIGKPVDDDHFDDDDDADADTDADTDADGEDKNVLKNM